MKRYLLNIKNKAEQYKTLIQNFSYLSALQLFTLLLPLCLYPYLINILGANIYGKVIYAQSLIALLSIVINFGFDISATKDISQNREDKLKLSEIVSSLLILKLILWFFCLIILSIIIFTIPYLRNEKLLYIFSFTITFNELLFLQSFFQGIEKMKYITLINLTSKLIFFCSIFLFINQPDDFILIPLLNGSGALIAGIIALYIIFKKEKIAFRSQPKSILKSHFISSLPFFGSRVSSVIIDKTIIIVLGSFIDLKQVTYFDLAQKITTILKIPFNLINNSIYPLVSKTKDMVFVSKILKLSFIFSILMYLILLIFAKDIVLILGGQELLPAVNLLKLLSFSIIATSLTYHLGNCVLVINGKQKEFNLSVIYPAVFFLISISTVIYSNIISVYILAIIAVITEYVTMLYRLYFSKRFKFI